eukprot:1391007-Rhodomonas_salina.2
MRLRNDSGMLPDELYIFVRLLDILGSGFFPYRYPGTRTGTQFPESANACMNVGDPHPGTYTGTTSFHTRPSPSSQFFVPHRALMFLALFKCSGLHGTQYAFQQSTPMHLDFLIRSQGATQRQQFRGWRIDLLMVSTGYNIVLLVKYLNGLPDYAPTDFSVPRNRSEECPDTPT